MKQINNRYPTLKELLNEKELYIKNTKVSKDQFWPHVCSTCQKPKGTMYAKIFKAVQKKPLSKKEIVAIIRNGVVPKNWANIWNLNLQKYRLLGLLKLQNGKYELGPNAVGYMNAHPEEF